MPMPKNKRRKSSVSSNSINKNRDSVDKLSNVDKERSTRKRVSVKDFAVLVTLATFAASGLVTAVFGYDALVEKCAKLDILDISLTLFIFALLIGAFTYFLLRVAAHYIVYLGFGVLFAIIYPCHPSRAREALQRIFNRNKNK